MRFFKRATYILFLLSIANLTASGYIYYDMHRIQNSTNSKIELPDSLKNLPAHSQLRESQLMQAMLMVHHQLGIHQPGKQPLCPMCRQAQSPQRVALTEKEE